MEENENKTVEEEVTRPSREEILAMSREENKKGDEMKKNIYKTGASLALRVGIIIAIIFSVVSLITGKGEELMLPLYSVVFGMMAADYIYIGKMENRKGLFALAIVLAVLVVVITVLSILWLCGVIL